MTALRESEWDILIPSTQDDDHRITVARYVERPGGSVGGLALVEPRGLARGHKKARLRIAADEVLRRGDWPEFVNAAMTEAEAESIRLSIRRDRPYGTESWTRATAAHLGLESSLRSRGAQRRGNP